MSDILGTKNVNAPVLNNEKGSSGRIKIHDNNHNNSSRTTLPDAKWIEIFINGDEHFSGCRCVVNSRYYRNLDMFLSYLTERLKPSFGAVRNIYTPVNGHPVLNLEDLVSKNKYVVAGNERFKRLEFGYAEHVDKRFKRNRLKPKNKFKISKAKPLYHSSITAYFHLNGSFKAIPSQVILLPQDTESWESVFKKIQEVMKCGPIKRICLLNGKSVHKVEDLKNNQAYVVIGKYEVFKIGHYATFPQQTSSSKRKYLTQRSSRKSSSVITTRSSAVYSRTSARSSRFDFIHSANKTNLEKSQEFVHNSLTIAEPGNGAESLDSFNPHGLKLLEENGSSGNKIKIDLDDDHSGIFRSKKENHLTAGAIEIEDTPETVVDFPVDLLDAEEVEDDITPDMERSLQHLSLDVSEEIVAYLPAMQTKQNSDDAQVTGNKYDLSHSQSVDIHNIFV